LHALMACWNAGLFVSRDEPFATASIVNPPEAGGSGKSLTPLCRMHPANFTACSWREVGFPPPLLLPFVVVVLEPQALISPTMAIRASAASGRRFRLMGSPAVVIVLTLEVCTEGIGPDQLHGSLARGVRSTDVWAAVRAGGLEVTPPFKAAWCCRHVCVFRYTDDMSGLTASSACGC
jgi:hypothetical protein